MHEYLRESIRHGTEGFPFAMYRIHHPKRLLHTSIHWHEEVELIYVESGSLYLTIGADSYVGMPGDLFFINAQEIHGMYIDSLNSQYVAMVFSLSWLTFRNMDDSSRRFLLPLSQRSTAFVHRLTETSIYPELESTVHRLIDLNIHKRIAYQLGTKVCLLELFYLLFSAELTVSGSKEPVNVSISREILSYVQAHCTQDITLRSVAEEFHMSEKYFSRFFKKTFHQTFVDYIHHLRIEKAAELLTQTDRSITEIALECGFSSSSYFNKRFKALLGVTPSSYRK